MVHEGQEANQGFYSSVSDSAWESIQNFQANVDFCFTTIKLGFWNISKYLGRYGIQMHPSSVTHLAKKWTLPGGVMGDTF